MNHLGDANKMVSDTPRTDAGKKIVLGGVRGDWEVVHIAFSRQLERELNDGIDRIKRLLAERDTARLQSDQKVSLREEFRELLGTDDIEQGVAVVREMKNRIKRLEQLGDALANVIDQNCDPTFANDVTRWRKNKEAKP